MSAAERFWPKVDKESGPVHPIHGQCWIWTGAIDKDSGYGKFGIEGGRGGKHTTAHRASYLLNIGPLTDEQVACHHCDNRSCVRPDHIFAGTQQDNIDDMHAKGRAAIGERSGQAVLAEADVLKIRELRANGESLADVASKFGISDATVWDIEIGRRWSHVGGPLGRRKKIVITDAMAEDIRALRAAGATARDIAKRIGVSMRAVYHICSGRRHARHVA